MSFTFELQSDLERQLRRDFQNLEAEVKEAFLVDFYRRGKLSRVELSKALGLDRCQTDEVLHKHNVTEDLGSVDDYVSDIATLESIRTSSH